MKTLEKLSKKLENIGNEYKATPFWSWNNELDEKELVKQIEEMHSVGFGGFIMHARLGLTTEYLGEKWFSCVEACLKKAKELKMSAWVYDDNGWPSGFVGGKLLENEEYRAQFLEYKEIPYYDDAAFAIFVKTENGYSRITEKLPNVNLYYAVYLRTSPANTDILNPEVTNAFIRETHEKYYERFKKYFGKVLAGFFTDEPQYYRSATPYSHTIASEYKKRYDSDLKDCLIWLFNHDESGYEFRVRYYTIANDLYVENYYKKLYDWCNSKGCLLTGHSVEENSLAGQMLGGAGCMPTYEYENIPAIDYLGKNYSFDLGAKQVGSVASQLGKQFVLTETFGCSGNDVNPRELKGLGEFQYFNGVSKMCHHLFPYSMAGQAKHDHPPVFSKHCNWWNGLKTFNDYFTKLGYIVANTQELYDVLVIHPLRSVYLNWILSEGNASVAELENDFKNTLDILRKNGVTYQLADERILSKYGKIKNGKLLIGKNIYDSVIVPKMKTISSSTLNLLKEFSGDILVEEVPKYVDGVKFNCELRSNTTYEDIISNARIKFYSDDGFSVLTARKGKVGDFLFIKNYSATSSSKIITKNIACEYKCLDLENLSLSSITDDYILPPAESLILIKCEDENQKDKVKTVKDITERFAVTEITDNFLVCDFASISFDGKNYGETAFIQKHFEDLLRADYKGKLYVRHKFNLRKTMSLKFIIEKNRFISIKLNGNELQMDKSAFDFNYCEADITQFVKNGENELVYCVDYYQHDGVHFALFDPLATESLRNCLYYDTHIENVYLKGNFVVNDDLSLSPMKKLPEICTDNHTKGYPFFKGAVTMNGVYEYSGKGKRIISLIGKYQIAEVIVNGIKIDVTLSENKDITSLLKVGKNNIKIILYSSLRNLFGPHHCKRDIEERSGIGPWAFTMRGRWQNGTPDIYTEKHVSVPFGLEKIKITSVN